MPKRVPIQAVKSIGKHHNLQQVILVGWDGERTHVVTWGRSIIDCDQAAMGGDLVKKALGWPDSYIGDVPSRVEKLQKENVRLKKKLKALGESIE